MSNKTLKQRIAIVAASALTAGVMSVIAAPSATAFDTEDGYMSATTGSTGLVASTIDSNTADTTKTAVLLSTGSLVVTVTTGTNTLVVSSGAVLSPGTAAASAITADQSCAVLTNGQTITIRPTGAVGSTFTVSTYTEDTCATAATLSERATVTIAATSQSGTAVAANSRVRWTANNTASTGVEDTTKAATTTGNALYMYVQLRDAYLADVSSTSGALVVTASAGANVVIGGGSITTFGTTNTAVSAADPSPLYVAVTEATDGAGWNGTVTVTYNGVVMGTKTGTITGKASKLNVAALKVGKNDGSANAAALAYQVTDNAGNNIAIPFGDIVYSSSTVTTLVSAAAGSVNNSTSDAGLGTFTCANSTSAVGTANIVLQTTLTDGTIVLSNPVTVTCGGAAASYSASWDKATYAQGDVAKLTIQFRDSKGAVANSYDDLSAATNQAITANQMERVTAHTAAAESDGKGQLVYTFTVGTSTGIVAGKYNSVVSFPTVNDRGAAAGVTSGNVTTSYEISGGGAVSNADVLKSIVSLIASINKQIQALQKLILRR
jgi:hypothetical protein